MPTGLLPHALGRAYRASGADPPRGRWVGAHPGIRMEGWFWRVTDRDAGTVVLALLGVSRDDAGRRWGTVALAGWPSGALHEAVAEEAEASADELRLRASTGGRTVLRATADEVDVHLGPDARLRLRLDDAVRWPAAAWFGGVGPAHLVPGLSQYWHPHVLTARASGEATLGGRRVALHGGTAYAEKNWGRGGFPPTWWWGQAHGFADPGTLVCFAGGRAGVGPLRAQAGSVVVRLPGGEVLRVVRPLQPMTVAHDPRSLRLRARTGRWSVQVEVDVPEGHEPHHLPVPVPAHRRNEPGARQHLAARTRLVVRRRGRLILDEVSALAGFERGTSGG